MARVYRGTRVDINDATISASFGPGGDSFEFTRNILRKIFYAAIRKAPKRSGGLASKHHVFGPLRVGRYRARGSVYNSADYADAVHKGTLGKRIVATSSDAMPIPVIKGGPPARLGGKTFPVGPKFKKKSVKGQRAQPWLQEAADEVLLRER